MTHRKGRILESKPSTSLFGRFVKVTAKEISLAHMYKGTNE